MSRRPLAARAPVAARAGREDSGTWNPSGSASPGDRRAPSHNRRARAVDAARDRAIEHGVGASGGRVFFESVVAEFSRRQYGLVTRRQLISAGVRPRVVDHAVATGRLRAIYRGVYGAGPVLPPRAAEMAAVLACGENATVSHRSAAALWQLLPPPTPPAPVEVTVQRGQPRKPGIKVYRVKTLPPDERTLLEGVPVTTPARTILDLAGVVSLRDLERALARAERSGLVSRRRMAMLLGRYPRRAGAGALRALLEDATLPALTRSEAEERFLEIVRRGRLRDPKPTSSSKGSRSISSGVWSA